MSLGESVPSEASVVGAPKRERVMVVAGPRPLERNMENVLYKLLRLLCSVHDVILVGPIEVSERTKELRAKGLAWRAMNSASPLARLQLAISECGRHQCRAVLAFSSIGTNGLIAAFAGRLNRVPGCVRINSDVFKVYRQKRGLARWRLFIKNNLLGRLSMRLASRIVVLHPVQEKLVAPGRAVSISQPISFATGQVESALDLRGEIQDPVKLIGFVGRLDHDKGTDFLAAVIGELCQRCADMSFVIVGEGDRAGDLRQRFDREERVRFLGALPREQLSGVYRQIDVLIQPSASEGLSNVILEAQYFGVPVVARDSGEITRAICGNICVTPLQMVEVLLQGRYRCDELPPACEPAKNTELWLRFFAELTSINIKAVSSKKGKLVGKA